MARRILVPTDHPSAPSEAGQWAAGNARHDSAELLLLRVVEVSAPAEPDRHGRLRATLDPDLTTLAHKLAGERGRGLVVESADPADAIVHVAEAEHVDLIVCGNSGMRDRTEFLLKNVPNRVSHMARCTVVL